MKALKIIGYVLLGLAGVYLILAVTTPASLVIEKTIVINAKPSTVFAQVACFDAWPAWSYWDAMDTTNTNEYSDNPCGLGAWNTWKGKKTKEGKQVITEWRENEYIKTSLVFSADTTPQTSEWFFTEVEGGTEVKWNFIGSEASFFTRPMNLMGKFFLSSAYESGLAALKTVAEAAPEVEESAYDIVEVDLPDVNYLLISGEIAPSEIGAFFTDKFGKIMAYMGEKGVETSGHPSGLYYFWSDTLAKMSAAIPVAAEVAGTDSIEFRAIEATKALQLDYYGAYDQSEAAHYAIDDYMVANGLELNGAVREVYVTDPATEPDTSKWLTQIIYPIVPAQ